MGAFELAHGFKVSNQTSSMCTPTLEEMRAAPWLVNVWANEVLNSRTPGQGCIDHTYDFAERWVFGYVTSFLMASSYILPDTE